LFFFLQIDAGSLAARQRGLAMFEASPLGTSNRFGRIASLVAALSVMISLGTDASAGEFHGYKSVDFNVGGRGALLVIPKTPLEGNPWIWRTEFFGVAPQADIALLEKGVHVGYVGIGGLFGAPIALDAMDLYYDYVCENYNLSAQTVLEGFSRGGLYAFNWAIRNPTRVAAIYADAPVCDFKSWPGGYTRTIRSGRDWRDCLNAYGMTEAEAVAYKGNPIDNLAPMAKANIPILIVCGDTHDWIVPIESNAILLESRYKELGGDVTVIKKPGAGHRPHSLPDPTPIVEFVLKHTAASKLKSTKWSSISARKQLAIKQTVANIPVKSKADRTTDIKNFSVTKKAGDLYGARVRGFVHPPKTLDYTFGVAGDDEVELYLSTDESPKNKVLMAFVRQPTENGNFRQFPSQRAKSVRLEAGKKYYIETLHKENTGSDHMAVGWSAPDVSTGKVIPGEFLSPYPAGPKGSLVQEMWLDPAGWAKR
jgi:hypothetical protein